MDDTYELAIASYALALAGSSQLNTVLNKLDVKATISGRLILISFVGCLLQNKTLNDVLYYLERKYVIDFKTVDKYTKVTNRFVKSRNCPPGRI